jgi:hypothetical protein
MPGLSGSRAELRQGFTCRLTLRRPEADERAAHAYEK